MPSDVEAWEPITVCAAPMLLNPESGLMFVWFRSAIYGCSITQLKYDYLRNRRESVLCLGIICLCHLERESISEIASSPGALSGTRGVGMG